MQDVAIVGAGFSGLYMLHRARDVLGLSATVFERGDGVGGTWYWNRYPGARCDSESHVYSYSFSHELEQEWEWSRVYPEQHEILSYLNHVADRFDLRRNVKLCTAVTAASYDEEAATWSISTDDGATTTARFLVSAVGCLSAAHVPKIAGLEDFAGDWFHTGAWPHEGVDFSNRRVGLIGTGSTGIQIAPMLAAQARHLTVFQRTPAYSTPAVDAPLPPGRLAEIKADYDAIRDLCRHSYSGHPYDFGKRGPALAATPEERSAVYEELWNDGGVRFLFSSFDDIVTDLEANATVSEFVRQKIRDVVSDQRTAQMLTPHDYPYGAKRPVIDTNYFQIYNRPHVSLVDLRQTPIVEITKDAIRTTGGDVEVDAIVFATGFDAMTGALLSIDIRGRHGETLRDHWADGPSTYLGLQVSGFPNLFTITGPGSPSVMSNMPVSIEQHVEWISDCIAYMRDIGARTIEADPEAEASWTKHVASAARGTIYERANSWYLGANIPGKTRVFMPYVGGVGRYRDVCDKVVAAGYEGFVLAP